MSTLNHLTDPRYRSKQLIVLDTTNSSGLFVEDYVDILMLTQPHSLLSHLHRNTGTASKKLILNSQMVTRAMLRTILFRDTYFWKRPFVATTTLPPTKPPLILDSSSGKQVQAQVLQAPANASQTCVLDLFDAKYSNPILSIQDTHDIYYSSHVTNQSGADDLAVLLNRYKSKRRFRKFKRLLTPFTLAQFDDNNVCVNTLKKLVSKSNGSDELAPQQFLLHSWLYEKKEVKSNLELTKSLKLIQPVLYDTVQKKHITSNMWESFQGPLTWLHFCRLAFRDASSKQGALHHQTSIGPGTGKKN